MGRFIPYAASEHIYSPIKEMNVFTCEFETSDIRKYYFTLVCAILNIPIPD